MIVKEILKRLNELVDEDPKVVDVEINACGADSVLRVFRETPDGSISGLSLEDEDYMKSYIEHAEETVQKLHCGTLSEKHMEYLIELCENGEHRDDLEAFVREYAVQEAIGPIALEKMRHSSVVRNMFPNPVTLKMLHPFGAHVVPAREISYVVHEEDLEEYLKETGEGRTVKEFLETYTSEEADALYGYMSDEGKVLSEDITYSDAFEEDYMDFIRKTQIFNPNMSAEEIATKEQYYWNVYAPNHEPKFKDSDSALDDFFKSLRQQEEKYGVEICLTREDIRDEKHLNCLWYGGDVGSIKYRDYEIVISAYGDINLGGLVNGKEINFVNKMNDGSAFSKLGKMFDDDVLQNLIDSQDPDNYLVYEAKSWFEVDLIGPDGTWIDLSPADNILDDNILECFKDVSEYFEYVDMDITEKQKETTFEQALKVAKDIHTVLEDNIASEMTVSPYSFMYKGIGMYVFATIKIAKDCSGTKWFEVYSGVEFDEGDTLYADFEHSTNSLDVTDLAKEIQELANYYKSEKHIKELVNNPDFKEYFENS